MSDIFENAKLKCHDDVNGCSIVNQAKKYMNECSNQGTFSSYGFCQCNEGYYGGDCSITVSEITDQITLWPREWKYFYFNEDLTRSYKVEGPPLKLIFWKGALPTFDTYDIYVEGTQIDLTLDLNDLYVGIYNSEIPSS